MDRNYFMVRAMSSKEEHFKAFFDNSVVAVGWSDIDFSKENTAAELRQKVYERYHQNTAKTSSNVSRQLNEVERFKGIKKGDIIIVPYYSYITIAEAEDREIYSEEDKKLDLANQRRVSYRYKDKELYVIPRSDLSEGLQRRLRVRGTTVANLYEFKDEIECIFTEEAYSYSKKIQEKEEEMLRDFKEKLLKNIQTGKTNLQTGGIGLEKLVKEIMECEGYSAKILPKNGFEGSADADIHAFKEDYFNSTKIFVQVKHHSGYSGDWGIQQLLAVLKREEYKEYKGWFITSALVSEEVRREAAENDIEVVDGNALVDLVTEHFNFLSETTKRQLGICSIPRIL